MLLASHTNNVTVNVTLVTFELQKNLLSTTFFPNLRIKKLNDTEVGIQLNPIMNVSRKTRVFIELSHTFAESSVTV